MSVKILSVTLLLLCACLCFQSSAGNRRHPTSVVPLCCTKVSSVDISAQITGRSSIQKAKGQCVHAIIFHIKDGKVCVDPTAEWAQKCKLRIIKGTHTLKQTFDCHLT
uniref:Chemokine interleukin-8-like domain-containing protein n=1 Tax=Anabas testudineus TaxID=64144 RepID=A0AAQ6IRL4_ANATE